MPASMTLQFIEQGPRGVPSTSERRLIRSHVMKGKNAGRPRKSIRKQTASFHVQRLLSYPAFLTASSTTRQPLWHDLCFTTFPQPLDPESTKIMHRWFFDISDGLFPPQFCSKFDIIKSIWVNFILADEAYFHSTLAISSSFVNFYQRKTSLTTKTLHHIVRAYALVNAKLSSPDSVSDTAIAAVVSLVMYQQIHGEYAVALVHLKGLYQMVNLRGGTPSLLKHNPMLALKVLRVDLELALHFGSPTLSDSQAMPNVIIYSSQRGTNTTCREHSPGRTTISELMVDVTAFASLLNLKQSKSQSKLDPLTFMEIPLSLLFRLVEANPSGHFGLSYMSTATLQHPTLDDEVAHLGMLVFMTTFLPEYDRAPGRSSWPLLCKHLEKVTGKLDFMSPTTQHSDFTPTLLLWTLFIGGVTVWKNKNRAFLLPMIVKISGDLGLHDWPAVRRELNQLPWIHIVHDFPGYELWQRAQQMR